MTSVNSQKEIVLITGTSRGIGEYLSRHYISKGYIVVGCSRGVSSFTHQDYFHIQADISSENEVLNIFSFIRKKFGTLSVLINNAAINPAILSAALLPYPTMEQAYKVNVLAPMLFCRESIKLMSRKKKGRIITLGSMATKHEVHGEALYTSTKAALIAYTRVIAKEIFKQGITANVIAPSAIKTELSKKIDPLEIQKVLSRNAITVFGELEDVSNIIDYLISSQSNAITGQVIYLGGA